MHDHKSGRDCLITMLGQISTRLMMMTMMAEAAKDIESEKVASACGLVVTTLEENILPHSLERPFILGFVKLIGDLAVNYPDAFSAELIKMARDLELNQALNAEDAPAVLSLAQKKEIIH